METKIVIISNIIFEPYLRTYLFKVFLSSTSDVQLTYVSYEEINKKHIILQKADIIALCLNFDMLYPNVINDVISNHISVDNIIQDASIKTQEFYSIIKKCSNAKFIWFGFEDYYITNNIVCGTVPVLRGIIDRINQAIGDMLIDDVYVDFKRLIAKVGIQNSYSSKGKYRWNAPYSKELMILMADEVHKQYLIHTGRTKKCIVLDCDNVLWGVILSEDGIEGIYLGNNGLGREFQDFQRFLLTLYYHGVILTVCSKNDELDVLRVFREHSGMILKEEHIACFRVNWDDKSSNIKMIADELNIGMDSMVFVDDSAFEIEAVKTILPAVKTVQYDREFMYDKFSCFNLKNKVNISDVESRNETYRTNQFRRELKVQYNNYHSYVNALDVKIDIHKILPTEYSRVAELTQRTNKCTNGKRYTVTEIKERMTISGVHFYSVSVSDRFSNLGITGAIEIENAELKLFSLSCRALGRDVENEMIKYISDRYGISTIEYKLTEKNELLSNLLCKTFPNAEIISIQ